MENANPFGAAQQSASNAPAANAQAESVETKVSGEDAQERTYTGKDLEAIVKDRLAREQKKFAKEREEWQKKSAPAKASPNLEEDFKNRQAEWENEKKSLSDKLSKYRGDSLRAAVERKLNEHDCLDTEVVYADLISRNLVEIDEDGNVQANNVNHDLDDLVKDYLGRKPHLVRAGQTTGAGTKAPKNVASTGALTRDQLEAQLGITKKVNPFKKERN